MPVSAAYKAFIQDLLSGFGPVSIRNMFSGAGLYTEGVMFGLLADDTLYLKADELFASAFAAEGKGPFTYRRKGRAPVAMSYWKCPSACSTIPRSSRPGQAARSPLRSPPRRDEAPSLLRLDALHVLDDGFDVVRAEQEDRHVRMA